MWQLLLAKSRDISLEVGFYLLSTLMCMVIMSLKSSC